MAEQRITQRQHVDVPTTTNRGRGGRRHRGASHPNAVQGGGAGAVAQGQGGGSAAGQGQGGASLLQTFDPVRGAGGRRHRG